MIFIFVKQSTCGIKNLIVAFSGQLASEEVLLYVG